MAELGSSTPPQAPLPDSSPLKPVVDDETLPNLAAPAISADGIAAKAKKSAPVREQREKKDSLKKREAKGVDTGKINSADGAPQTKSTKKAAETSRTYPELQRYVIEKPKPNDFKPPAAPVLIPDMIIGELQLHRVTEHVHNKRGFRYRHAIADPEFPHTNYTRQTEVEPFCARFDYEDSSANIQFSEDACTISTDRGFRMSRSNVGLREGRWYWEIKVVSGIHDPTNPTAKPDQADFGGHFRAGISRREASLEHPCGFDSYSYAIRDAHGQKFHMSMPDKFFPPEESMCQGDVIGFELQLPSLALHRKIVEGVFNKAVDIAEEELDSSGAETVNPKTLLRDRYPIRYKNELYHEHYDYQPTKELEERFQPPTFGGTGANSHPPNPNHQFPALRTLPKSHLKVYKNGKSMGVAFEDLLAFLPPASRPSAQGVREGLDDGTLGYYPSVSVFSGGAIEANFGPDFAFAPSKLDGDIDIDMTGDLSSSQRPPKIRPVCERYDEQIAEDIVFDIIDEVDCWIQDGQVLAESRSNTGKGVASAGIALNIGSDGHALASDPTDTMSSHVNGAAEAIKELVQDDE